MRKNTEGSSHNSQTPPSGDAQGATPARATPEQATPDLATPSGTRGGSQAHSSRRGQLPAGSASLRESSEGHGFVRRLLFPRSLRYQLLSRSLLILSGLLLLIGVLQYVLMSHFLYTSTATNLRAQVKAIPFPAWVRSLNAQPSDEANRQQMFSLGAPGSTIVFIDQNGTFHNLLRDPNHEQSLRLSQQAYQNALANPHSQPQYQIVRDSNGDRQLVVLVPVGPEEMPIGVVQVATSVDSLQEVLAEQLIIFLVLASGALILGLVTFLPILRRTLVPLSQMVGTVERINAGNLDVRFSSQPTQTEIQTLSSSFNAMLERLKVSFEAERAAKEKMRQFIADASHELRTPLTSIHGFLEVLLRGAATTPEQLGKSLRSMYGEAERLTKLVQDLLALARLDREPTLELADGRLDLVLSDMEPQLRLLAGERAVIVAGTDSEVWAKFDRDRIKQVILNLFQNAVQHTDAKNGEIAVTLAHGTGGILLTVRDNGVGIPVEYQGKLFERFYRIDSARSRMSGGAGLGLAITKSIVEGHGGAISVTSQPGQGATFRVWLPDA